MKKVPKKLVWRMMTLYGQLERLDRDHQLFNDKEAPLPNDFDNFKQQVECWIGEHSSS